MKSGFLLVHTSLSDGDQRLCLLFLCVSAPPVRDEHLPMSQSIAEPTLPSPGADLLRLHCLYRPGTRKYVELESEHGFEKARVNPLNSSFYIVLLLVGGVTFIPELGRSQVEL